MKTFKVELAILFTLVVATILYKLSFGSLKPSETIGKVTSNGTELIVLGVAQDAGFPQANCKKSCCKEAWGKKDKRRMVSCLGIRDPKSNSVWLFDATPDFKDQLHLLLKGKYEKYSLGGIFITHGHIGHYTGLMNLGREAMGAKNVPVYCMPRMESFLKENGPWSQLVSLNNINIKKMKNGVVIKLNERISIEPILVPHREEFSETVGYLIDLSDEKILFIPDIDKWEKWEADINGYIQSVSIAFVDGSFYQNGEIWGRNMSEIPHPFIVESMERFKTLSPEDKAKINFIHLNHTNPVLNSKSDEYLNVISSGYNVAKEGQVFKF